MTTRTDFEYLMPTTLGISGESFTFEEPELPPGTEAESSPNDIGYFMELARRYPLLGVTEESELARSPVAGIVDPIREVDLEHHGQTIRIAGRLVYLRALGAPQQLAGAVAFGRGLHQTCDRSPPSAS